MTGYGHGGAERGNKRAAVEVRAVNHRFVDIKLRGSGYGPELEELVATAVRKRIERGAVTVWVRLSESGSANTLRVDTAAARHLFAELNALREALGLAEPVTLELLCAQPGVLVSREEEADIEATAACVEDALEQALTQLVRMREVEGAALSRELAHRCGQLAALVERIQTLAEGAVDERRTRLEERLKKLLRHTGFEVAEDRLAQEIAVMADRLDVTEELVRLHSHLEQFAQLRTRSTGAVGRRLEFLVQEMAREFNTIGAKSQSAEIACAVVDGKAELEKVREQVQNLE